MIISKNHDIAVVTIISYEMTINVNVKRKIAILFYYYSQIIGTNSEQFALNTILLCLGTSYTYIHTQYGDHRFPL